MNKRAFFEWLKTQGCDVEPREGINNSAPPLVITNSKNGRFSYLSLLARDEIVPRKAIEKVIRDLGIEPPKGF
jgi:hypothetical protein